MGHLSSIRQGKSAYRLDQGHHHFRQLVIRQGRGLDVAEEAPVFGVLDRLPGLDLRDGAKGFDLEEFVIGEGLEGAAEVGRSSRDRP